MVAGPYQEASEAQEALVLKGVANSFQVQLEEVASPFLALTEELKKAMGGLMELQLVAEVVQVEQGEVVMVPY